MITQRLYGDRPLYWHRRCINGGPKNALGTGWSQRRVGDRRAAASRSLREQKLDVIVIGQALHSNEKRRIFQLVRQHCPTAKVLELFGPGDGEKVLPGVDDSMEVSDVTDDSFADRVSALATRSARRRRVGRD